MDVAKMWFRSSLFSVLLLNLGLFPAAAQTERDLARCAVTAPPVERLSCYDEIVRKLKLDGPWTQVEQKGKWRLRQEKSKIDDSLSVMLSVEGDTEFKGWLKTITPALMLRCKEGKTEAYVVTGMHAHVERYNLDGATVTIRLDENKAFRVRMSESTDGEALFFSDAKEIIQRMTKHQQMLFQFVPFNASPTMTTFPISDLEDTIKPLRAACHW
jgi:type VI secretion system protein VasI